MKQVMKNVYITHVNDFKVEPARQAGRFHVLPLKIKQL